jgi:hypothetical protein
MKEETLEEAAERFYPVNNTGTMFMPARHESNNNLKQKGFVEGAKWQFEQIPSIIEQYLETAFVSKKQGYINPKDWFNQFKK